MFPLGKERSIPRRPAPAAKAWGRSLGPIRREERPRTAGARGVSSASTSSHFRIVRATPGLDQAQSTWALVSQGPPSAASATQGARTRPSTTERCI